MNSAINSYANQRGVALVVTLVMLLAMSMLAISSIQDTTVYTNISSNAQGHKTADMVAQLAVEQALVDEQTFDRANDLVDRSLSPISFNGEQWDVTVKSRFLGTITTESGRAGESLGLQPVVISIERWDVSATVSNGDETSVIHQGFARKPTATE